MLLLQRRPFQYAAAQPRTSPRLYVGAPREIAACSSCATDARPADADSSSCATRLMPEAAAWASDSGDWFAAAAAALDED